MKQRVERLETLVEISRQLGTVMDFRSLLECINSAVVSVLDCQRASIFLHDAERGELYSVVASNEADLRFPSDRGIAGHAFHSKEILVVSEAYNDPRFNPDVDRKTGFKTENLLSIPLLGFDGQVVGVLQALNKLSAEFSEEDVYYAGILGSLAGTAVQRQILFEQFLEKQRLAREMELAREIQQSLLPRCAPSLDSFEIAGWNKPASHTGGDFFDFVPLSESKLAILFGDATGHGVGPALIISECRALTRALLMESGDISAVLASVNDILCQDLRPSQFVTLFCGVVDSALATLEFASAGQAPLFFFSASDRSCARLSATTRPLGLIPGLGEVPLRKVLMNPGDLFGLFTDGFYEWSDADGNLFGAARIEEFLRGQTFPEASEMISNLYEEVCRFSGGTSQDDDLTAVLIRRLPGTGCG